MAALIGRGLPLGFLRRRTQSLVAADAVPVHSPLSVAGDEDGGVERHGGVHIDKLVTEVVPRRADSPLSAPILVSSTASATAPRRATLLPAHPDSS